MRANANEPRPMALRLCPQPDPVARSKVPERALAARRYEGNVQPSGQFSSYLTAVYSSGHCMSGEQKGHASIAHPPLTTSDKQEADA